MVFPIISNLDIITLQAEWRDREEDEPDFVFPYHLGKWENFKMVFHWSPRPQLNGIWWPVIEGCNQFTLTVCSSNVLLI